MQPQGERAVGAALGGGEPLGGLLLDQDGDGLDGGNIHQRGQHGRGDVVGQVGADDGLQASEFFADQGLEIQPGHISGDDLHIRIKGHGLCQNGQQRPVQFNGDHLAGPLSQLGRQRTDARADLQHAAGLVCLRRCRNVGGDLGVDEKILPHGFGKMKAVAFQQHPDRQFVAEIHGSTAFFRI